MRETCLRDGDDYRPLSSATNYLSRHQSGDPSVVRDGRPWTRHGDITGALASSSDALSSSERQRVTGARIGGGASSV